MYLPLFDRPVAVPVGDPLDVHFERHLSDDGVHPDYRVSGQLHTGDAAVAASFLSRHHGGGCGSAAVDRELFVSEVAA